MKDKLRFIVGFSFLGILALLLFFKLVDPEVKNGLHALLVLTSLATAPALILGIIGSLLLYFNYLKSGYFFALFASVIFSLAGFALLFLEAILGGTYGEALAITFFSILIAIASIWGLIMVTTREREKKIIEKALKNIIEKALGEEIELATLKYTVNGAEEKPAKDSTKFVFVDLSITNINNASFTFPAAPFVLIDDKKRSFRPMAEAGDQYLTGRQLAPGKTEKGFIVYEIPTDAASYGISTGKKGTEETYNVILKSK